MTAANNVAAHETEMQELRDSVIDKKAVLQRDYKSLLISKGQFYV